MTTEAEFRTMVERHDLTFEYSDDGRVWRNGCASLDAIRKAAADLPYPVARDIWNAQVDAKLREGYREPFYWSQDPTPGRSPV